MKDFKKHFVAVMLPVAITLLVVNSHTLAFVNDERPSKKLLDLSSTINDEQLYELTDEINLVTNKISYPEIAKVAGINGKVIARIFINESGVVDKVKIVKDGGCGFDESVVNALKDIKFKPVIKDGVPVKSQFLLTVNFEAKAK